MSDIPRRPFGRAGDTVSIIGLGGYHLGTVKQAAEATRIVHGLNMWNPASAGFDATLC